MGDQEQSGRPAPVFSVFDNVGIHVPTAIRGNIWAGGHVNLEISLKKIQATLEANSIPQGSSS